MAQLGNSPVINTEVVTVRRLAEGMADYLAMLAYYRDLGFQPTGLFPVAHDRKTGHVFEFDAVFARRDVS